MGSRRWQSLQGGETEALSRLAQQLSDKQVCLHFHAQHMQCGASSAERLTWYAVSSGWLTLRSPKATQLFSIHRRQQWVLCLVQCYHDIRAARPFCNTLTCVLSQRLHTQVLSPYLKFGCISPRLFYSQLMQV